MTGPGLGNVNQPFSSPPQAQVQARAQQARGGGPKPPPPMEEHPDDIARRQAAQRRQEAAAKKARAARDDFKAKIKGGDASPSPSRGGADIQDEELPPVSGGGRPAKSILKKTSR